MDPQTQALITQLMGGQNSMQPPQVAPMPSADQFSPQSLGYGQPSPAGQMGQGGMFTQQQMPYGAQAQQNMTPQNMTGY